MVARSHPPVVFGAGAVQPDPDKSLIDADLERLKARAARFHTDIKPAVAVSAKQSKPVIGADFDLLTQEEVEKRRQRAQKFGTPLVENGLQPALTSKQAKEAKQIAVRISEADVPANTELTDAELADQAEQRRQTALTAERRPDTVHLHGVHFMTSSDCLHFFTDYNPASVEWLSDASCNVIFHDADSASKAISGLGTVALPEEDPDGFGFTEADVSDVLHMWHQGMGYAKGEVDNFPVELLFRLATTADIKQVSQQKQQGGGRGKKAHRGKGKGRGGRGQQKQQQQKRQFQDMDGDVEMRHRGERGGKRYRRQKGVAMGVRDVEMHDAEAFDDDSNNHLTNAEVRQAAAYGDESFLQQAYGPGTMFSASAVGAAVTPSFQHYAPVPAQDIRDVKLVDYGDI